MKRIAMFNCQMANRYCTGAACLKAFNRRTGEFARYQGEDVELVAFARCNGCGQDWKNDEGLAEKLLRLHTIGTDVVHFGVCTCHKGQECSFITRLIEKLSAEGIVVVRGTHATHSKG
jgi:predicted metal-binding protein